MTRLLPARFDRYVAIGDSSTEGLDDPDGHGGYRGWSQRLAERLAAAQGGLLYANLAIRGRTTRRIRDEQLAPALAMRPDLATLFTGTNDVMAPRFDLASVAADTDGDYVVAWASFYQDGLDRKSVVKGKSVDLGGRRIIRSEEHTSELQSH